MADEKVTDRSTTTDPLTDSDIISLVDVSDTTQNPAGSDYKYTLLKLANWAWLRTWIKWISNQFIEVVQALEASGSTVAWDWSLGNKATLALGGNWTLSNPTNKAVGRYTLTVTQDATGGRTLSFGTDYLTSNGDIAINTAANAVSILVFDYDGVKIQVHSTVGLDSRLDAVESDITAINIDLAGKAETTQTDFVSCVIEAPDDLTYKLIVKAPYDLTITETTTIATAGTCTATFKINTTALGGTANAVSTSEVSESHSTSNAANAGDDIVVTISSNASCEFLSLTIKFTRTLA